MEKLSKFNVNVSCFMLLIIHFFKKMGVFLSHFSTDNIGYNEFEKGGMTDVSFVR